MNRPLLRVATAAIVLVLAAGCTSRSGKGIRTAAVRRATVTEVVDAPATVQARAAATITSPADGRVARLYVTDGQRVRAGALLATIDSPSAQQRLAQARQAAASSGPAVRVPGVDLSGFQAQSDAATRAAFAQAQAATGQITDPAARAAAQRQLAATEAQYAAARGQATATVRQFNAGLASLGSALRSLTAASQAQARAAVALAQATVDALTLRAPIAGTVQLGGTSTAGVSGLSGLLGQLPADSQAAAGGALSSAGGASGDVAPGVAGGTATGATAGAVVATGTAIVTLVDVSALGLQADVDETDVLLVTRRAPARVELDAVPGATYDAMVAAVDLSPTTSSRGGVSYRVRLTLGAGHLPGGGAAPVPRPGMSAVAHLMVRTVHDAVAVSAAAVIRVGSHDAVWLVVGGIARRRYITVGTQGQDMVAVTAGLRPGDRVVVAGAERVHSGQRLP